MRYDCPDRAHSAYEITRRNMQMSANGAHAHSFAPYDALWFGERSERCRDKSECNKHSISKWKYYTDPKSIGLFFLLKQNVRVHRLDSHSLQFIQKYLYPNLALFVLLLIVIRPHHCSIASISIRCIVQYVCIYLFSNVGWPFKG